MQKSPKNSAGLFDTYLKAKTTMFFGFDTEITDIFEFLRNCKCKLKLHLVFGSISFCVKALRQ
jgi:hypothetical protein